MSSNKIMPLIYVAIGGVLATVLLSGPKDTSKGHGVGPQVGRAVENTQHALKQAGADSSAVLKQAGSDSKAALGRGVSEAKAALGRAESGVMDSPPVAAMTKAFQPRKAFEPQQQHQQLQEAVSAAFLPTHPLSLILPHTASLELPDFPLPPSPTIEDALDILVRESQRYVLCAPLLALPAPHSNSARLTL
jgi:hypothetical protein